MTPTSPFDIFVTTRHSVAEPFGQRVKLPPSINSEGHDYGPALTSDGRVMFFSSGRDNPFAPGAINHLFVSKRSSDRAPWGPPIYLDTLNCATCFGGLPTIRADGQQICWMGDRGDSLGDKDIYCATRR
jgi:WD40-like Beta Propeller Repeat